jgi:hypothetical protein
MENKLYRNKTFLCNEKLFFRASLTLSLRVVYEFWGISASLFSVRQIFLFFIYKVSLPQIQRVCVAMIHLPPARQFCWVKSEAIRRVSFGRAEALYHVSAIAQVATG